MNTVIEFREISKRYRIGAARGSLRSALTELPRRLLRQDGQDAAQQSMWALRDVSFAVESGEVLGLIGANGAGKTTSLKILTGVTKPTSGALDIRGRVSSLIELGAGFHPDLTGRENIYLNGTILGLSRTEIDRKFDSIVAFSGLAPFLDMPVKRYSSGMYVRLGFSVAAHVDPDILLVDEVLAVGDHEFQTRCIDRFRDLQKQGVTTVIVAHNRHLIESMCSRVIYLRKGQVMFQGPPSEAWDLYLADVARERVALSDAAEKQGPDGISIVQVEITNGRGERIDHFKAGEPMQAAISFEVHGYVEDPVFYSRIYHGGQALHGTNSARWHLKGSYRPGDRGVAWIDYESLNLLEGTYAVSLGIEKSFYSRVSYDSAQPIEITVSSGLQDGAGQVHMPHRWRTALTDHAQDVQAPDERIGAS